MRSHACPDCGRPLTGDPAAGETARCPACEAAARAATPPPAGGPDPTLPHAPAAAPAPPADGRAGGV